MIAAVINIRLVEGEIEKAGFLVTGRAFWLAPGLGAFDFCPPKPLNTRGAFLVPEGNDAALWALSASDRTIAAL